MRKVTDSFAFSTQRQAIEALSAHGFRVEATSDQTSFVYPKNLPANYPEDLEGSSIRPAVAELRADGSLELCYSKETLIREYHVRIAEVMEVAESEGQPTSYPLDAQSPISMEAMQAFVDWCKPSHVRILTYADGRPYFLSRDLLENLSNTNQLYTRIEQLIEKQFLEALARVHLSGRRRKTTMYRLTPLGHTVLQAYNGLEIVMGESSGPYRD